MAKKDPRVDAYIEQAPAYGKPILRKLRRLFHRADPRLEETIKWGNPTFMHEGIVCGMSAHKQHVAFGYWKARVMKDPEELFSGNTKQSPFAIRVTTTKELPPDDVIVAYTREAVDLNERGVEGSPSGGRKPKPRPLPKMPADLAAAFRANRKAKATYDGFSPTHKREYLEWILEAKRDATREKRLATAIEWMAEGKPRNWKYMRR